MGAPIRVLMVEDSQSDAVLLKYELQAGGYEPVLEVVETREAMKAAMERAEWDLVIADYDLPQFTGVAALWLLKETGQDLPFIVVSGRIGEETAVMMMKAGAHDYVMKNNLARLVPAVERELREAKARREQRRTEKALAETEALYRRIVETGLEGIWAMDSQYRTTFVNARMTEILGYGVQEMLGRPVTDFMFKSDLGDHWVQMTERQQGRDGAYERRFRHRDGREVWCQVSARSVRDEQGHFRGSFAMLSDITDRKRMEATLISANLKLESLWKISSLAEADIPTICDYALEATVRMMGSPYGFYGFINEDESAMTIHAWSGEAMKGCGMADKPQYFPICDAGVWGEAIRQRSPLILNDYAAAHPAKKGFPAGHVFLTRLLVVPVFTQGRITAVAAVANRATDYGPEDVDQITVFLNSVQTLMDKKLAEERLRISEENLRSLFNAIHESVCLFRRDGMVLAANETFATRLGRQATDCVGRSIYSLVPADVSAQRQAIVAEILQTAQPVTFEDERQGQWLNHSLYPILNADRSVDRLAVFAMDITGRKQAEEAMQAYQERLRSLASELVLAEEQERRRIAVELHDRIGQALILSKMKLQAAGGPIPELYGILDRVIDDTRALTFDLSSPLLYEMGFETAVSEWLYENVEKQHGIATEFVDDHQTKPLAEDARIVLFRAVRELLVNVVKHARAKNVKVAIRRLDDQIQVEVQDNGQGFVPASATRRGPRNGGVGLFSIRERLEHLGGRLEIQSEPDHGTRVTLTAPLRP